MLYYRNDDVRANIPGGVFEEVHALFREYKRLHTLSVVCQGISEIDAWVRIVQEYPKEFEITLHGWEHEYYTILPEEQVRQDIERSSFLLHRLFGKYPQTWYLPWNGWVGGNPPKDEDLERLKRIAKEYGLSIKLQCSHIGDFLRGIHSPTVYFHWWDKKDIQALPELLRYEE